MPPLYVGSFRPVFLRRGLCYDILGNITQLAKVIGTTTYDGNGLRVKKVSGAATTVYIFSATKARCLRPGGPCGMIAEYDNSAVPASATREYIYSGSALLAKIDSSGTKYYHQDHLSNRLVTDSTGNTAAQMGHYPFGESWYNASSDKLLFTSYERDAESGNDYALARYYVSRLGRFSSPDPLAGSTDNPQSLNRYSYVLNVPTSLVDPSGADPCDLLFDAKRHKRKWHILAAEIGPSNLGEADAEPQDFYDGCGDSGGGGGGGTSDPPLVDLNDALNLPDTVDLNALIPPDTIAVEPGTSVLVTADAPPDFAPFDFGPYPGGLVGPVGGNIVDPSPTRAFFKSLFTLPSTGPGSCLGIFTDTVKAPLQQVATIARNVTKYVAPVAPLLPGVAAQLGSMDPNSALTFVSNPDGQTVTAVLSANAAAATTGLQAVAQAGQAAIKAVPTGTLLAVDGILLNGVIKEAKAALNGGCKP